MSKLFKSLIIFLCCMQFSIAGTMGLTEGKRLSVFGDFLYWNISEQTDSVWANDIGFPATNHVTYSTPNVKFNWNSGFRAGFSYQIPDFWDLTLYTTQFITKKSIHYVAAPFHLLTPEFFSGYLSGDSFSSASMNWRIAMNTIDFAIRHQIRITQSLMIRPSLGLKRATINQKINLGLNNTLLTIPIFTATEVVKNNFTGMGPGFGLDGKYPLNRGFSIVGNFSTAFLWGRWNVNDRYSRPSALGGLIVPTTINTQMSNARLGTEMFQFFAGIEWVHESKYQTTVLLGYEMQYWASQLRAPTFQLLPLHGDLTLQGLTCGITLSL